MIDYMRAMSAVQNAQVTLANKLIGKDGGFSRSLFTKAFPKLGDLTIALHAVSDTLLSINDNIQATKLAMKDIIERYVDELTKNDVNENRAAKKKLDKDYDIFENRLICTLSSRQSVYDANIEEMCELRKNNELARFDFVVKLNKQECKKKIILTRVSHSLLNTMKDFYSKNNAIIDEKNAIFNQIVEQLPEAMESYKFQDKLWGRVRARLQGELMGAMPAPGSPAGALSPICPRSHQVIFILFIIGYGLMHVHIYVYICHIYANTCKYRVFLHTL